MDKYAVLALCFLLVFQGVTQFIVISRATDYSIWRYHKVLTITNSTALPVGYQLNFTLWKGVGVDSVGNFYLNNHASDNLYDLRFVDGNGILLDMWNQTAIVGETHVHTWIELASSLVVVMYYGNEYAGNEWDAAATVFERVFSSDVALALPTLEGAGSTAYDYSGNGNNGTITGAAWTTGKFTHALDFDGTNNDYISIANDASMHFASAFSVSLWVYPDAFVDPDGTLIGDYAGNFRGYWIYLLLNGKINFRVGRLTDTTTTDTVSSNTLNLDAWNHIVCLYNGTKPIVYVNGVATAGVDFASIEGETGVTYLGRTTWVEASKHDGLIEFASIFNRTLSASEVADLGVYYPQTFSNHLGSMFLREWATGVSTSSTAETDAQATEVTTQQDVNWMAFIVLLAFAFLNVVLMLVPRFYVLNFVVGALTLAFSAATVNDSTLPIQPYFSLIVALLSVLGILRAANLLRNQ